MISVLFQDADIDYRLPRHCHIKIVIEVNFKRELNGSLRIDGMNVGTDGNNF